MKASDSAGEYEFEPPGNTEGVAFFRGQHPPDDKVPEFRHRFPQWLVTVGLRRHIEVFSAFLQGAALMSSDLGVAPVPSGKTKEELPEYLNRLSLPEKLRYVEGAVGPVGPAGIGEDVLSLNRARNCLEHRLGRVSKQDVGDGGFLTVQWRKQAITPGRHCSETEKTVHLNVRFVVVRRRFRIGDEVAFTAGEFTEMGQTLLLHSWLIVERLKELRAK